MGLDGVELVMAWEESFGITIADADAEHLLTPRMAIDYIHSKLVGVGANDPSGCLTRRAFHRVRQALHTAFAVPVKQVRPRVTLAELLPAGKRGERWRILQEHLGEVRLPRLIFGLLPFKHKTVGALAMHLAAHQPACFRKPFEPWTRAQVRALVRTLIAEQLGIERFDDGDEFVRDLRVG